MTTRDLFLRALSAIALELPASVHEDFRRIALAALEESDKNAAVANAVAKIGETGQCFITKEGWDYSLNHAGVLARARDLEKRSRK